MIKQKCRIKNKHQKNIKENAREEVQLQLKIEWMGKRIYDLKVTL